MCTTRPPVAMPDAEMTMQGLAGSSSRGGRLDSASQAQVARVERIADGLRTDVRISGSPSQCSP